MLTQLLHVLRYLSYIIWIDHPKYWTTLTRCSDQLKTSLRLHTNTIGPDYNDLPLYSWCLSKQRFAVWSGTPEKHVGTRSVGVKPSQAIYVPRHKGLLRAVPENLTLQDAANVQVRLSLSCCKQQSLKAMYCTPEIWHPEWCIDTLCTVQLHECAKSSRLTELHGLWLLLNKHLSLVKNLNPECCKVHCIHKKPCHLMQT